MEPNTQNVGVSQKSNAGPIVAIVIVLILLVLGSMYFFNQRNAATTGEEDISEIEADLQADADASYENDLNQIDNEFAQ